MAIVDYNSPWYDGVKYDDMSIFTNDNIWTLNEYMQDTVNSPAWAHTNDTMFTTMRDSCFYRKGAVSLSEIKFYCKNSKYGTIDYGWKNNNKTWNEISENTAKTTDIFMHYINPSQSVRNKGLRFYTAEKPITTNNNIYSVTNFDMSKFLPFIEVKYFDMYDDVNECFSTSGLKNQTVIDLKSYIDLKNASLLGDKEFYKRYPIMEFRLVGYYGNAGDRIKFETHKSTTGTLGFTRVNKNTMLDNIYQTDALHFTTPETGTAKYAESVSFGWNVIERNANSEAYIEKSGYNENRCSIQGTFNRNFNWFEVAEFTIAENESLLDENNKGTCKQFKDFSNVNEVGMDIYAQLQNDVETKLFYVGFFTIEYIMKYVSLYGVWFTSDKTLVQTDLSDLDLSLIHI